MQRSLAYRPDIDGLRGIAVLSVIIFHAEIAFPGGFLGVDLFFVISGFLITSILLVEYAEAETINLGRFYERRIRRIFPALIATCLACIPFAFWLMLPAANEQFFQSMAAAQVFMANVFFWLDVGYFSAAAETKPLLHTWSLAVEEQYYLVFPFLALLGLRFLPRGALLLATIAIFVASLALAGWGFEAMRSAAFYLTPFRVWELFAGVLAALISQSSHQPDSRARNVLAAVGLVLIAYPIVMSDPLETYAVPSMLAVVAGAALVILYAQNTVVGRLLSSGWLVLIGKISYSAYLVHQPIFVFARLASPRNLSLEIEVALAAGSLAIGWASWRFIEKPFRRHGFLQRKTVLIGGVAAITAGCALAIAGWQLRLQRDWPQEIRSIDNVISAGTYGLSKDCSGDWAAAACATVPMPNVALWGDSFAMHLAPGLKEAGVGFRQMTLPSCSPKFLDGPQPVGGSFYEKQCARFNLAASYYLDGEIAAGRIDTIILSSRDYGLRGGRLRRFPKEAPVDREKLERAFQDTLEELARRGVRVGVVGPPPPTFFDPALCVLRSRAFGLADDCAFARLEGADGASIGQIAADEGIPFLNLADLLCEDGVCQPVKDGDLIYRDNGHLTPSGASWVWGQESGAQFMTTLGLAPLPEPAE